MKQTKLISLLLVLCMVVALLVPGTVAMEAKAADGEENDGLVLNKTATAKDDGTYTITLEAYATGESVTSSTKKDVPTDIILVLDDSGSMDDQINEYSFRECTGMVNRQFYAMRHNGGEKTLYYKLDDGYVAVSVTYKDTAFAYSQITNGVNEFSWGSTSYYDNRERLFALVDGEYVKVTVTKNDRLYPTYTYKLPDGTEIDQSDGWAGEPDLSKVGGYLYLQSADESKREYTYSYVIDGNETIIASSVGADSSPETTLYEKYVSSRPSRLSALKTAVNNFASQVGSKSMGPDGQFGTEDDVKHRVAVVSFADSASTLTNGLEDMTTETGRNSVSTAFNKLRANGATRADLGMNSAEKILRENPVQPGEQRNRVVIFFTDGVPTSYSSFDMTVANNADKASTAIKGLGAKVYSVGIFNGADATSAGDSDGSETEKANWFMQKVSSNNGEPQSPSYYLSAADAGTLNSIFQQISDQIQEGGSSIELGAEAVVRDEISPYFALPEGVTEGSISVQTVPYEDENKWGDGSIAEGVNVAIKDNQVSITGFDFSENWCGPRTVDGETNYSGKKLVISFNVVPKDGFLGGNNVPTNANAGVYENPDKTEPLKNFPVPEVNVPIKDITVTAGDKNVYLLGDLTKDQLTSDATVKAGENIVINLDPTVENYGLETWQNEFVKIEASLSDSEDKPLESGFADLKKDTDYQLTVTVSPKEEAKETSDGTPADEKTGSATGKVNVFKPEITWQDSQLNSGETPDYKTENFVKADWKHDKLTYTKENMTGEEPTLTYTYDPVEKALTEETPVKVAVMIDNYDVTTDTFFLHDECTFDNCKWETEYEGKGYRFVVHLDTFDLTITKSGCNETLDPNQSFVFHVTGPNGFSMEVVIKGNGTTTIKNLPAGDYTVTEDTGWSWRYSPSNSSQTVTADSISDGKANVKFVNTRDDDHWLDGNAYCENKFTGIPATK